MRQKAVVFDIDGTICKIGNRGIYEYSKVYLDTPIADIIELIHFYSRKGYKILYVTARSESSRSYTLKWLITNVANESIISNQELHMRTINQEELKIQDAKVKSDLIIPLMSKYNIRMVFDDSERCCRMYKNKGLHTMCVMKK